MQAVTPDQFNSLQEQEQLDILESQGALVAKRFIGKVHLYLFQVFSFYVELQYRKKRNDIIKMRTLSLDNLEPYLKKINLDELSL